MFSSKSFLITGILALILGGGQFLLMFFGKSFAFYRYFGTLWPIAAGVICVLGIVLVLYPFLGDKIKFRFSKKKDKN